MDYSLPRIAGEKIELAFLRLAQSRSARCFYMLFALVLVNALVYWLDKQRCSDSRFHSLWCFSEENLRKPIRSTPQIWLVTRHQYRISAVIPQTAFRGENHSLYCEMPAAFSGYALVWCLSRNCVTACFIQQTRSLFKHLLSTVGQLFTMPRCVKVMSMSR